MGFRFLVSFRISRMSREMKSHLYIDFWTGKMMVSFKYFPDNCVVLFLFLVLNRFAMLVNLYLPVYNGEMSFKKLRLL